MGQGMMVEAKNTGRSDCVNASNPYHRCGDGCFKGIDGARAAKQAGGGGGTKDDRRRRGMAEEKTVNPHCVNASNPFHICAEYCSQRSGPLKAAMAKKKPEEGGIAKGKVHPDCPDASNPYHVCAGYCFEKIAKNAAQMGKKPPDPIFIDSLNIPGNRKKKGDDKSQYKTMQMLDDVCLLVKVRSADAPPPSPPLASPVKSGGLKNPPPSGGGLPPSTPNDLSGAPTAAEDIKCVSDDKPTKRGDSDPGENIGSGGAADSMSSNISGVTVALDDDDEDERERPKVSGSKVLVGNYQVNEGNASVLRWILEQHGDIAADCHLESALLRSYYLDCVCSVVRELQSTTPFTLLTKSRARELSAILDDAEAARMDVGWLRQRLEEIMEAMDIISQHRSIKAAKVQCEQSLAAARKELEAGRGDLGEKEKVVEEARERVLEMERRVGELEAESSRLKESYSTVRRRVEKLQLKPLLDAAA